jgi:cardiolipin synthase
VEALVERCRAGVRAAILLDAHGSMEVPGDYIEALKGAGCEVVPDFRPLRPWRINRSNLRGHRRIVVVDGRVGLTGGYGIDEQWTGDGRTPGHWRETNVCVKGPIVQELQAAFLEHWREATGALPGGKEFFPYPPVAVEDRPVRTQVVKSSPFRENYGMYALFLQVLASARRSILISTPYFMPGDQMTTALVDAVRRGVNVVVLIPALMHEAWIELLVQESQREGFGPLLESGIQLYEYHPGLLHTKTMVIDGVWATIGSLNFDNRSMGMNDELNLVVYDKGIARQLQQIFLEDLAHSKILTREQLRNRGWLGRVVGLLASPFNNQF